MKITITRKDIQVEIEIPPPDFIYIAERLGRLGVEGGAIDSLVTFFTKQLGKETLATILKHETGGVDDVERILKSEEGKEKNAKRKKDEKSG